LTCCISMAEPFAPCRTTAAASELERTLPDGGRSWQVPAPLTGTLDAVTRGDASSTARTSRTRQSNRGLRRSPATPNSGSHWRAHGRAFACASQEHSCRAH
jgi:hypothetical protein